MEDSNIQKVTIIGVGTMGAGIALSFARAGFDVSIHDISQAQLDRGLERIENKLNTMVAGGLISATDAAPIRSRIQSSVKLEEAIDKADFVNEAVPEILELKQQLFAQIEALVGTKTVLATNTSGLSITAIAEGCRCPERVGGLHWFNPPELVPLVEIVRGRRTSDGTVQTMTHLSTQMDKAPIVVNKDVPGFVGNRLQYALFREALHLVAEGVASPEDVDTAVKRGLGFRWSWIGPMETADLGGIDVFHRVSEYLFKDLCHADHPPEFFRRLFHEGKLGLKSGQGFYKYDRTDQVEIIKRRDLYFIRQWMLIQEILEDRYQENESASR